MSSSMKSKTQIFRAVDVVKGGLRGLGGVAAAAAVMFSLGACEAKATPEECEAACGNLKTVFLGQVEREAGSEATQKEIGATGAELVRETASLFVDYFTRECTQQCNARSTRKVTDCLKAAQSVEAVKACYE